MKGRKLIIFLIVCLLGLGIYQIFWGVQSSDLRAGTDVGNQEEQQTHDAETIDTKESGKVVSDAASEVKNPDTPLEDSGEGAKVTSGIEQKEPVAAGQTVTTPKQEEKMKCTLSISCATILDNMDSLNPDKAELIPKDGIIFSETTVSFSAGETVFDVLKREMKNAGIHMEFVNTPGNSVSYIEGIANIYELDCGPLSGWMYKINGDFINYGCSLYELKDGDSIKWVYSCDLGKDVGNSSIGG